MAFLRATASSETKLAARIAGRPAGGRGRRSGVRSRPRRVADRRRLADAVAATALVVAFILGPFVLAILWRDRLDSTVAGMVDGRLEVDLVAVEVLLRLALVVAWTVPAMSVLARLVHPGPLRHRRWVPFPIEAAARQVVDQSMFGAGAMVGWRASRSSAQLSELIGPDGIDIGRRFYRVDRLDQRREQQPAHQVRSPLSPTENEGRGRFGTGTGIEVEEWSGAVVDHIVARGDTWWGLAERSLGNGSGWATVRALNIGRVVAPDTVLQEHDELRRGWHLVLPAPNDEQQKEEM